MSLKDRAQDLLDAIDLLAAHARPLMVSLWAAALGLQGLYAAHELDRWINPASDAAKWAGFVSLAITFYVKSRRSADGVILAAAVKDAATNARALGGGGIIGGPRP